MQTALVNKQIVGVRAGAGELPRDPFCPDRARLSSKQLWQAPARSRSSSSRVLCASTRIVPKKKNNMLADAEQRWLCATENPLEGLSFTKDEFAALLSKYDYSFEVGDMVQGTVFGADKNGALVDIGGKAPAFLPINEASLMNIKSLNEIGLVPGVTREFYILREDDSNGRMVLSLKKIQLDLAWERCRQLQEEDAVVRGPVVAINRGGLLVNLEGLRGFAPLSHIPEKNNLEEYRNRILPFKFLEVVEEENRLILSHRFALVEYQASSISTGSVVEGVVVNLKPFGAFIAVGGAIGLLHISEISHTRVSDIHAVFQPGDKLKAMVINQDLKKGKIGLSTKKLEPAFGDMLRNPQLVYDSAEEMARKFMQRITQHEASTIKRESTLN